jgi:hypothetical protein
MFETNAYSTVNDDRDFEYANLDSRGEVMPKSKTMKFMMKFTGVFFALLIISVPLNVHAQAVQKVTTYRDDNGWKLLVDGQDFYVKGVVWGYSPKGENYNYNLWGESDEFIKKVLEHDFSLMKKAGVNAIRAFSIIPPKWVTYIYEEYGIMSAVNPFMGRYGATIDGVWKPQTDYSDPRTREVLKEEILDIVRTFKNTPGVLMYALGNESNYGLEWSASFEIENLPEGEQQIEKARYLYSLYNEVITAAKAIDDTRPYSIVNGDIQYIDLIKEYVTELDVLGTNIYRGIGFAALWKDVDEKLDLPILFFEHGADAFNAKNFAEDQPAQASFLRGQWQEMYSQSYGNGGFGNSIGGFVFEFRDEWWKYKQTENLNVHDRTASWAADAYTYDYVKGQNNMNEEWWGIARLGEANSDGVYEAVPRMAYDVMTDVWKIDPYKYKTDAINTEIQNIPMDLYAVKGDVRALKSESKKKKKFELTGGSLEVEFVANGFSNDIKEEGEEGVENTNGQMVFVDFAFNPTDKISGQFSINVLGNVADKIMEISYGRRGLPVVVEGRTVEFQELLPEGEIVFNDRERVEIYDYDGTYTTDGYDLTTFYHVPRFHWGYEGDFFGLLRETTDMKGQDIWNAKAPFGAEFAGKQTLDGFKFLLGPEVYWGANPKWMLKYQFDIGSNELAFIHSEDVARNDDSATATAPTAIQTRQTTLYSKSKVTSGSTLELGGIMASTEKIDDPYERIENGNVVADKIEFEDTLGLKATFAFDAFTASRGYLTLNYGGLVADGGEPLTLYGVRNGINNFSELPLSEYGNKQEVEAGIQMQFGNITVLPRLLYRDNLVDALPLVEAQTVGTTLAPGTTPRNRDDDAFAVLGNREARSGEVFLTYDPTPDTHFYEWDNDRRENAPFAFNIGGVYTNYPTPTDSHLFFFEPTSSNAAFGEGLIAEDVWKIKSRMVFNTEGGNNIVLNLEGGFQQSARSPEGPAREYYKAESKFILPRNHIIEGYVWKDAWGPYDFYRDFNVTYPWQAKLDYSVLMGPLKWPSRGDARGTTSKWGVRGLFRTLDENSPDSEYQDGKNDWMFEIIGYVNFAF